MEPIEVTRTFLRAWVDYDMPEVLRLIAPDARYSLHLSDELLPFGGETVGRDNIEAALRRMRQDFEYILFRPMGLKAEGDVVRLRVEFMYRHNASGEMLAGRFRLVFQIKDGLLVKTEEYHDRAMVETFVRLHGGEPSESA